MQLGLRLRDHALRLVDRRVGALGRGVVLGQKRVELGAVEPGEHLPLLDLIAVLGVDLDDREPVDAGRHLRFLARDQGAGDEQAIDEFAPDRGDDRDRRRFDRARLIGRGRRRAGAELVGSDFRHQRGRHRAWSDNARRPDAAERNGRNDRDDDQGASHRQASSPGAAGSAESLPAKSALRTPIAISVSASGSKSGSTAIRLKSPAT